MGVLVLFRQHHAALAIALIGEQYERLGQCPGKIFLSCFDRCLPTKKNGILTFHNNLILQWHTLRPVVVRNRMPGLRREARFSLETYFCHYSVKSFAPPDDSLLAKGGVWERVAPLFSRNFQATRCGA